MSEAPSETAHRATEPTAGDSGRGSFGAWLRHQREARSVSLREIADSSKISLRYLDALEQDRFDVLPAPVFARGFLREYARVVGLNPDEVVNLFLVAIEERKSVGAGVEPSRAARARKAPSSFGYGLLLALAVIAFLAVAAALSFYVERRGTQPPASTLIAPPAPTAAASAPDVAADLADLEAGTEDRTPVEVAAAQPQPAVPERLSVVLSFVQDCWVETVVDGRRRTSELRAGGESVSIEADDYVLLTLGNASVVSIEVNGRPFPLPAGSSRVVRELRIDRAAVAPAGAGAPADRP